MRIVSGSARGLKLLSLEGDNTRPTTDRVKEALFSIIQFNIYDSDVLDLFSGSGALGIEALSRGAKHCDFVDNHKPACDIIEQNLKRAKLEDKADLHFKEAKDFLCSCNKKYDIIFLDPPYNKGLCMWAVKEICNLSLIKDNGIFVCETSAEEVIDVKNAKRKEYGKIAVTVIKREELPL